MYNREEALRYRVGEKEFLDTVVKENTEKYRKGNARVLIVDENGEIQRNKTVKIRQVSHEFKFGANLFLLNELETDEKNEKYKSAFSELFNMATLPFYWDSVEPEKGKTRYEIGSEPYYRRPPIDLCMDFCRENGIEPREHALAYENHFPVWLKDSEVDESLLRMSNLSWDEAQLILYYRSLEDKDSLIKEIIKKNQENK